MDSEQNMATRHFKYDDEYLNELRENHYHVICDICDFPFEWPVNCHTCGDVRCYACIKYHYCNSTACTSTYTKKEDSINGNKMYNALLSDLQVICALRSDKGCTWKGTRVEYDTIHSKECCDSFYNCPFCDKSISTQSDDHFVNNQCEKYDDWIETGSNATNTNFNPSMMVYVKNLLRYNKKINNRLSILEAEMSSTKKQVISYCPNYIDLVSICTDARELKKKYINCISNLNSFYSAKKYISHIKQLGLFTIVTKITSIKLSNGCWILENNITNNNECEFIKTCADLDIIARFYVGKINTDVMIPCGMPFSCGFNVAADIISYVGLEESLGHRPFKINHEKIVENQIDLLLYLEMPEDLHLAIINDVTEKYSAIDANHIQIKCTQITNGCD